MFSSQEMLDRYNARMDLRTLPQRVGALISSDEKLFQQDYLEQMRAGKLMLTVHVPDATQVRQVQQLLAEQQVSMMRYYDAGGVIDLRVRQLASRRWLRWVVLRADTGSVRLLCDGAAGAPRQRHMDTPLESTARDDYSASGEALRAYCGATLYHAVLERRQIISVCCEHLIDQLLDFIQRQHRRCERVVGDRLVGAFRSR